MSNKEKDLTEAINSMEDLELYEEILELRVKAHLELLRNKISHLMKDSSGAVIGGLGGWLMSRLYKAKSVDNKEDFSKSENRNQSEGLLEKMDYYIGIFQKSSPVLRAALGQYESQKQEDTKKEKEFSQSV